MTSGQDMYAKKAGKLFDEGLKDKADVFGLMGKVRYSITCKSLSATHTFISAFRCIDSSFIFRSKMKFQVLVSRVTIDCCLFHSRHNIMNIVRTTQEHWKL